jgi:hypothetical protein
MLNPLQSEMAVVNRETPLLHVKGQKAATVATEWATC